MRLPDNLQQGRGKPGTREGQGGGHREARCERRQGGGRRAQGSQVQKGADRKDAAISWDDSLPECRDGERSRQARIVERRPIGPCEDAVVLGLELGPPSCDPGLEYRGAGEGGSREELCEDAVVYVGA